MNEFEPSSIKSNGNSEPSADVSMAEQHSRLRRTSGLAFASLARNALAVGEADRALRCVLAGTLLADDPKFTLVPELFDVVPRALYALRARSIIRPGGKLSAVSVSADGSMIATGSENGKACVWDLASAQLKFELAWGDAPVERVLFTPDGKRLVTVFRTDDFFGCVVVVVWDTETGRQLTCIGVGGGSARQWILSADGNRLGYRCRSRTEDDDSSDVLLMDLEAGKEIARIENVDRVSWVHHAMFSNDGRWVAVELEDGVHVHDAKSGDAISKIASPWRMPFDKGFLVGLCPASRRALVAEEERSTTILRLVDVDTEKRIGPPVRNGRRWVRFSKDGQRLVVRCRNDKYLQLLDPVSGRSIALLAGHDNKISNFQFNASSNTIVTADHGGVARLWSSESGQLVAVLRGHDGPITHCAFDPSDSLVATASLDRTTRLWEVSNGKELAVLRGHSEPSTFLGFRSCDKQLVTAARDNTVRVWGGALRDPLAILHEPKKSIGRVAFAPCSNDVIALFDDGSRGFYNVDAAEIDGFSSSDFTDASNLPVDADQPAVSLQDHRFIVKDERTDRSVTIGLIGPDRSQTIGLGVVSPNDRFFFQGTGEDSSILRDVFSGQRIATLTGHDDCLNDISFSLDSNFIVSTSGDKTARVYEAPSCREVAVFRGHRDAVLSASFSRCGLLVVTASEDGTARVWHVETGQSATVLIGHDGFVTDACFSIDGKRIVTGSDDQTARIWDTESGRSLSILAGHDAPFKSVGFSPDGQRVLTEDGDIMSSTFRLWDAATGKLVRQFDEGMISCPRFGGHGTRLVTDDIFSTCILWDTQTGEPVTVINEHDNDSAPEFGLGGQRLLSKDKHLAYLWDADTGAKIGELAGHMDQLLFAKFDPSGGMVVTASMDGGVRLWDAANAGLLAVFDGHDDEILDLVFHEDGSRLMTLSADGSARVWDVSVADRVATAPKLAALLKPLSRGLGQINKEMDREPWYQELPPDLCLAAREKWPDSRACLPKVGTGFGRHASKQKLIPPAAIIDRCRCGPIFAFRLK